MVALGQPIFGYEIPPRHSSQVASAARVCDCANRIETGPPRVRTAVMYVDLGCWIVSGSIHPKEDPTSWRISS